LLARCLILGSTKDRFGKFLSSSVDEYLTDSYNRE
jgi:hypothetical protein